MSDAQDRIANHRSKLEQTKAVLNDQKMHGDENLAGALRNVHSIVTAMSKQLDARVGTAIVGRHSSGKSQLVGTLLGAPQLLPVAVRATTGNVTELELVAAADGKPTSVVSGPTVEFLDREDVRLLATKLVEALIGAFKEKISEDDTKKLKGVNPVDDGFAAVEGWLRLNWPATGEGAKDDRTVVIRQLLDLRDAVLLGPSLIGAEPVDITAEPKSVLQLPKEANRPHPPRFPEVEGSPIDRSSLAVAGDPERRAFPLIKRVRYRIAVDQGKWPLLGLPDDQPLVLLDFPGLDSGFSPIRDEFLTASEFRDIHTAAVCMEIYQLAGNEMQRVQKFLRAGDRTATQRERSLFVIATKFDLLAVPDQQGSAPPFSTGALELLDGHRRNAVSGDSSRVALTSAMHAVMTEGMEPPADTAENSEAVTEFRDHAKVAADRFRRWPAVAERIRREEPSSGWPELLDSVSRDGGLQRLRAELVRHVANHGCAIKADWLDRDFERLVAALKRVRAAEAALSYRESDSARQDVVAYLAAVKAAARTMFARSSQLADTEQIEKLLTEEAVARVYGWAIWANLLDRIEPSDDFTVPLTPRGDPGDGLDNEDRHDRTDTVQKRFLDLVTRLTELAADHYHQQAVEWLDRLETDTSSLRQDWTGELQTHVEGLLPRLSGDPREAERASSAMAEMRGIRAALQKVVTDELDTMEDGASDPSAFPLRASHYFSWSPQAGVVANEPVTRHQSIVLRMRANLADAAADVVCELLRGMAFGLADRVGRRAGWIIDGVELSDAARRPGPRTRPGRREPEQPPVDEHGPVVELLKKWGVA